MKTLGHLAMYAVLLFAHSWLRYAVLGFGLWLIVASLRGWRSGAGWGPGDERAHKLFLAVLDTQFMIGLIMYLFLSPITSAAFADFGAAMKDAQLRFWGVEHIFAMVTAVAIAHVGRVRSRRKQGPARHRLTFIMQTLWLVLTLAAIPWPGLDVARPLFRF